jgi:hypothetical protein
MKPGTILFAMLITAIPAALAAEPWKEVDQLPGGIAVELDTGNVTVALDGARQVLLGTFRKQLPIATMETSVAVDCDNAQIKIRSIRLADGDRVLSETQAPTAQFNPVSYGSAEAIYFKGLCGREIAAPPEAANAAPEDEALQDGAE